MRHHDGLNGGHSENSSFEYGCNGGTVGQRSTRPWPPAKVTDLRMAKMPRPWEYPPGFVQDNEPT